MEIVITIRDKDFSLKFESMQPSRKRRGARAVVVDKKGKVALLHVSKKHFHKLPGGGIEEGETIEEGLRREVSEEIGCEIENIRELGAIEEFRGKFSLHQISYCFMADISGEKGTPHLEPDEIEDGFGTVWMDLGEAITTLAGEAPVEDYEGKFVQKRDHMILTLAAKAAASLAKS